MLPYASTPGRASLQALADFFVVLWVVVWVLVGKLVHDAIAAFAQVGQKVQSGAGGISSNLGQAGDKAGRLPLVGDAIRAPLRAAGSAAQDLAGAGHSLDQKATWLAVVLALAVSIPPILSVVVPWLYLRIRFARRASAAATLARTPEGMRLLALRALATRPLPKLTAVDADPVEAWRRDDRDVVRRLAALELRTTGLAVPRKALEA